MKIHHKEMFLWTMGGVPHLCLCVSGIVVLVLSCCVMEVL